jgi:hypothetical protein
MKLSEIRRHFPTLFFCWSLLPKWLRRRPTLRGLMLLVVTLVISFGWVFHRARVQRKAVTAIESAGGSVRYEFFTISTKDYKLSTPKWLIHGLGRDYLGTVKGVHLPPPRGGYRRRNVAVAADHTPNPDLVMAHVGQLSALDTLQVEGVPITNTGLSHLRGLKRLKSLMISRTRVTGAGLERLAGLHELQFLVLAGLPIGDADLARLAAVLRPRRSVSLGNSDYLFLDLSQTQITDAGLVCLVGLRRDVFLDVKGTAVTDAGAAAFLKAQRGSVDR